MRVVMPICLLGVVLLGGAVLTGCQQDRAQRRSPAMQEYESQQDPQSGSMRRESSSTGTTKPRQQSDTIPSEQQSATSEPGN